LTTLSKDNSVESLATNFENLGNNIAFAIEEMAKLIKKFDNLVNNPSFAAGLLALAALSRNPKILAAALGTVGLNAASNVALGGGTTSTSSNLKNANARENRLQLAQIKTGTTYRKLENEQLKKKTEVDKLAEKFDLERIGLTKALNETTDAETKLRIEAKLAILDNNEALAKKIAAELEAAKKATELASAFGGATQALAAQMGKLQTAVDKAFDAILAKIVSGGFVPDPTLVKQLPLVDQLRVEKAMEAKTALNLSNPAFIASMASERQAISAISGGGNQFSLSFDTTFTGDRFTQLIAESLQLSEKTGYSTSPAGSLS
jgi:hypothetical protein